MEAPYIGKIITLNEPMSQFDDGCVYLLKRSEAAEIASLEKAVNEANDTIPYADRMLCYDFYPTPDGLDLCLPQPVADAVNNEGYDLLLPIYAPAIKEKHYLLCRSNETDNDNLMRLMVHTAERISTENILNFIGKVAQDDPEGFLKELDNRFPSSGINLDILTSRLSIETEQSPQPCKDAAIEDVSECLGGVVGGNIGAVVGGLGLLPINPFGKYKARKGTLKGGMQSFKDKNKSRKDLHDMLLQPTRQKKHLQSSQTEQDAQAILEILGNPDKELLIHFINTLKPEIRDRYMAYTDPAYHARLSNMIIELRKNTSSKGKNSNSNSGNYQLYLNKDNMEEQLIKFDTKNALIVYVMYLIDKKKRGENVDTIDICKNEKAYKAIYEKIYFRDFHNHEKNFNSLCGIKLDALTDEKTLKEPSLKRCYHEIKLHVGNGCANLSEHAVCHTIADEFAHIFTMASNINLPEEFCEIDICVKC